MKLRPVRALQGMVGAGHSYAAAEGLAVLRAGGNAIDAAVAAAAVLSVVSPHECGLGGDLLALVYDAKSRRVQALNASGQSPGATDPARFADGQVQTGPLSVSVPGMIGGWGALLERHGTRSLASLLAPAIRYAARGFSVYDTLIENSLERRALVEVDPNCKALFLPGGELLREGASFRQPRAAQTLERIAVEGVDAFYRGSIAESMARYVQGAGGALATTDLAAYRPLWQEPIAARFEGYDVHTMPPNSWGAATLVQLLAIAHEGVIDPARDESGFILQSIRTRQLAYKLLAGTVADPFVAGDAARNVVARAAKGEFEPASNTTVLVARGTDTSNVVVVDSDGNAVSMLQSVFAPFGSGLVDPETGVLFNNRMRSFDVQPGKPNSVGPGKRPAQTLAPALGTRHDGLAFVCATPGGPGQTGTVAQYLTRVLACRQGIGDAIAAPRWAMMVNGDFILEETLPEGVRARALAAIPAAKVMRWGSVNFGSMVAIHRDGEGWVGGADTRRNAQVLGY